MSDGWTGVEFNVCARIKRPGGDESCRDLLLSADEIRTFCGEADKEHPTVAALLKTHLLLAQRSNEIKRMAWAEIDFDDAVWTIPASRVKNKLPHRVPLSGDVQTMLKALRVAQVQSQERHGRPDTPWVFQSTRSRSPNPITAVQKATDRIRARCGFDVRTPDLRRTAASHMTSVGVPRFVVRMVLNHADPEITAVYDRYAYDREKRDALDKWARHVAAIIAS